LNFSDTANERGLDEALQRVQACSGLIAAHRLSLIAAEWARRALAD
jgi:hypothetical protein